MIKAVFFDLDGTLLPLNEEAFTKVYFGLLLKKIEDLGYEKDKFIKTLWEGTSLMYKNDGTKTNEEAFWGHFKEVYGEHKYNRDKKVFDEFYVNEFRNLKVICEENKYAKEIVDFVKSQNLLCVLSTNPIFPLSADLTRMSFVGLKESDFDYITAYENSSHSKPNPEYFLDLLKKFNLKGEGVILFGNNDVEDYLCASKCGIKCYLVGNHLILHPEYKLNPPVIRMEEVISTIKDNLTND